MTIQVTKFDMVKSDCPVDLRAWTMLAWQLNYTKLVKSNNNNSLSRTSVKIT
jgi:hypothetical protein